LGGRGVTERQIVEALWPEADGDAGHDAFAVTLHRLRRLLGHDDAVRRHGGRLELDPRIVWVDVRALDAYLERAAHTAGEARARAIDAAVRLYRGPLLAGDEDQHWTIAVRERLRARVLRRLEQIATSLEAAGQWQQAIDTYLKALEIDDCAEETCRRLMRMYQRLGRRAEAMRVYQRCRASLASTLRVPPSAETEALAREIRSGGSISRPGVSGM
jgi:DNA-binding SARP family transcriptional activator